MDKNLNKEQKRTKKKDDKRHALKQVSIPRYRNAINLSMIKLHLFYIHAKWNSIGGEFTIGTEVCTCKYSTGTHRPSV